EYTKKVKHLSMKLMFGHSIDIDNIIKHTTVPNFEDKYDYIRQDPNNLKYVDEIQEPHFDTYFDNTYDTNIVNVNDPDNYKNIFEEFKDDRWTYSGDMYE